MPLFQATVRFPSDACYLQVIREFITEMGKLAGLPEKKQRLITLAVDEACTNVIRHTYRGEPHHAIELLCTVTESCLEFCILDFGSCADLDKIRPRQLGDVRPGGLGTFFMKNIMDRIEYENLTPKGNRVRLTKFLQEERPAPRQDQQGP